MRTYLSPTKDASIYQRYPTINTGLDEILEIGKLKKDNDTQNYYASSSVRILMNFDISTQSSYPANAKYYLNLYLANAINVDRGQSIEVYPLTADWNEGGGYFYPISEQNTKDVTWQHAKTQTNWSTSGSSFNASPSASTQLTKLPIRDISIDVTSIMAPVVAGTNVVPWNGIVLKYPTSNEIDSSVISNIKFFSQNTSTIFTPTLEIVWNNQSFVTGSLKPIPSTKFSILPKNLKQSYVQGEIDKIYLVVRDQFPDKRFDATQRYKNTYYLPTSSYFRIRDEVSDVEINSFDQYSAINCDVSGSYISLDTTGLQPNRFYILDLKVQTATSTFFPEFNYRFKVEDDE